MATQHLAGVILFSQDPERLGKFYKEVLGIPFEPRRHGPIREHLECEFGNIHFAILKKGQIYAGSNIIPSFAVDDIQEFLEDISQTGVTPVHPIIDIGEGKRISTITDPDGNTIRIIQVN